MLTAQCVLVFRAVAHGLEHLKNERLEEIRRLIQDRCQKPRTKVVLEALDAGTNGVLPSPVAVGPCPPAPGMDKPTHHNKRKPDLGTLISPEVVSQHNRI